ncbi:hypothetical protein F5148DRAFT_599935 [Russula earlei]|uniref:Uncharacterized protein n=1 Tax=Russula earlei TaxID=71964 RepID=A0ACC0UFJ4_9AGAM|nr:hypothetical protein F5148DRAFT_599935 [Russula earlei]
MIRQSVTARQVEPSQRRQHLLLLWHSNSGGTLWSAHLYAGCGLKRRQFIFRGRSGNNIEVYKLVRMHRNDGGMDETGPGKIDTILGVVECASEDTFTDGTSNNSMTYMFVPDRPSHVFGHQACWYWDREFFSCNQLLRKEYPTFRVHVYHETEEMIISSVEELHLEIHVERM